MKHKNFFVSCCMNIRGYLYRKSNLVFVLYTILVISVVTFMYSEVGKITKRSIEEQLLHRQTVMVRMDAKRISEYFKVKEKELLFLASITDIKNNYLGDSVDKILIANVTNNDPMSDVIRADNKGIIQSTASEPLNNPKVNIIDRDYYIWSKDPQNEGKIFYSDVLESRGGLLEEKKIIVMATPVWNGEEYKGLIAYTISVQGLVNVFIEDMQLSNYSNPFLISSNGSFLYHNLNEFNSVNLFEYLDSNDWKKEEEFRDFLNNALSGKEQKTSYFLKEPDGKVVRRIVASTPVSLADGKINWTIGIAITDADTNMFLESLYQTHVWLLVYFMISTLGLVFIGIFVSRVRAKNAFIEGFKRGREN